jgi:twitching motility protein PilT
MTEHPIADYLESVHTALRECALFHGLTDEQIHEVASHGVLLRYELGEHLARQGEVSDAFDIFILGSAAVHLEDRRNGSTVELATLAPPDSVGEMGVLLQTPRSASVLAIDDEVLVIRYSSVQFNRMLQNLPYFGLVLSRTLAARLHSISRQLSMPTFQGRADGLDPSICRLLPSDFQTRHRVIPLALDGNRLTVGFVEQPTDRLLARIQRQVSGMVVCPVRLQQAQFEDVFRRFATGAVTLSALRGEGGSQLNLDGLLSRVVAEGASDLHLSAGQIPRWRIDGELLALNDVGVVSSEAIWAQLKNVMPLPRQAEFESNSDTDFAYPLGTDSRFRVNVFRDLNGVSSVFRHIPNHIRTPEQLGLPQVVSEFTELPHGLILITGPTGSGKSTTLAAMLDSINRSRAEHIVTLEDPIEFVHESKKSMVNQREVGSHTLSFSGALRAALREDPDIVLVGEMRDLETVSLAIEIAQTGHLVFATLHTSTAVGTIERVVGMFPSEQQAHARVSLAQTLKGIVSQTLLPRKRGGRVAAFEILVGSPAVTHLIRDGKSKLLMSTMETGRRAGNRLLNDELVRLVSDGVVEFETALQRAVHKDDLLKRLNRTS